jgi:phosphoribulokinase
MRRPIIIGIVGDSAAGKTTITKGLVSILGKDRVTHMCTDDYHKYDRTERKVVGLTALHPDCNYIDILELHMERLHFGQPILKPIYDHSTGTLTRPEYLHPKEFIIVEGLLGFSTPTLRQFYDVKVFLDPPETQRHQWKVKRDTAKRGYTPEQVLEELAKRESDSAEFIRPQREYADIITRFYQPQTQPCDLPDDVLNVKLTLRPTIPHPDLSYLLDGPKTGISLGLGRDFGKPVDILEIDGCVAGEHAQELEDKIWAHLPDLHAIRDEEFGEFADRNETRHSHPLALTQLLLVYHLLRKYSSLDEAPFAMPVAALKRMRTTPDKIKAELSSIRDVE